VAAYAASKGAVHSLTRALALDHAKDKIRVNSPQRTAWISAGIIETQTGPAFQLADRVTANVTRRLPQNHA